MLTIKQLYAESILGAADEGGHPTHRAPDPSIRDHLLQADIGQADRGHLLAGPLDRCRGARRAREALRCMANESLEGPVGALIP